MKGSTVPPAHQNDDDDDDDYVSVMLSEVEVLDTQDGIFKVSVSLSISNFKVFQRTLLVDNNKYTQKCAADKIYRFTIIHRSLQTCYRASRARYSFSKSVRHILI